ncbi:MAG: cysteine synthase A [Clostridiaceae bacterium]
MLYTNILSLIGNTPMVKLNKMVDNTTSEIYIKLEKYNIGGSIKDRAALYMIEEAEKKGLLKKDSVIIEPTSGNTGIGLALVGMLKGYKVIIVMPDSMSMERRSTITAYGASLVLTDGKKGMKGAIEKAYELKAQNSKYFIPDQFENRSNSLSHYETTSKEILKDIPDINAFIAGVGTGGTISGVGKRLKEYDESILTIAVEPSESSVLSGNSAAPHKIQGIGAGFIPKIYDEKYVDEIYKITNQEAYEAAYNMANKEGILVGISSGANIAAAIKLSKILGPSKKIVTIAPDGGEKYLSTGLFNKE